MATFYGCVSNMHLTRIDKLFIVGTIVYAKNYQLIRFGSFRLNARSIFRRTRFLVHMRERVMATRVRDRWFTIQSVWEFRPGNYKQTKSDRPVMAHCSPV